jgi:putative Mg2+ transporter-C (MgtC) family protein
MNTPLSFSEILLRMLAATLAGAIIGLEREKHGRPAGLRTTILACAASALAMIISESLFNQTAGPNWRPDPARLGAGILTGIGFLGAGTILRNSDVILGVTTAAGLWFVTVLGLAFGSGLFLAGWLGLAISLATLLLLPSIEHRLPIDWRASLVVTTDLDALEEQELKARLEKLGIQLKRLHIGYNISERKTTFTCELRVDKRTATESSAKAISDLRQLSGIQQIEWS